MMKGKKEKTETLGASLPSSFCCIVLTDVATFISLTLSTEEKEHRAKLREVKNATLAR